MATKLVHCFLYIYLLLQQVYSNSNPFIWPLPQIYSISDDVVLNISNNFTITTDSTNDILLQGIQRYMNIIFKHKSEEIFPPNTAIESIHISIIDDMNSNLQYDIDESYILNITNDDSMNIIQAQTVFGGLYALETLSQLIIYDFDAGYYQSYNATITDFPRFKWRGIMLDVARHFESLDTIKRVIRSMSYTKFNTLHIHFSDADSFPMEFKKYRKLWDGSFNYYAKYTQDDILDIVHYALYYGIRIIPEFDIPCHTYSWCDGYPSICTPNSNPPPTYCGALNPAINLTYDIISSIIYENSNIFMDNYQHIGGDECGQGPSCWNTDEQIIEWMKENNYNVTTAYLYFETWAIKQVNNNNKLSINWGDIFQVFGKYPGFKPGLTTFQIWQNKTYLSNVVKSGFQAILSNMDSWYLSYIDYEWEQMYLNEPFENITNITEQKLILGGEGCLWTPLIDDSDTDSTLWPRASAIAERLWSAKNINNIQLAEPRYAYFRCLLNERGIAAAPYNNTIAATPPKRPGTCYQQR